MMVPAISGVGLSKHDGGTCPLLVLGPSLGTSAASLWSDCAQELADEFDVVGWDLPGHGVSPAAADAFSMADLAVGVLAFIRCYSVGQEVCYAGDSIGGAVGLQVLAHPDLIAAAILICTRSWIGIPSIWRERAALVRAPTAPRPWPAVRSLGGLRPASSTVRPQIVADLVQSLCAADRASHAATCKALAGFDLRHRLSEIATPVYAVAGQKISLSRSATSARSPTACVTVACSCSTALPTWRRPRHRPRWPG
jgi:3-oxoadipate enol-lactonase/4-carboxymuconolactone decarboxylase